MQKLRTEPHPLGGTFTFFALDDGRHASILDDKYPYNDDFEIHLRESAELGDVIPGTEHHEPTMKAAVAYLEGLTADGAAASDSV